MIDVALLRVAARRAPLLLVALRLLVACVVAAVSAQPSRCDVIADVTRVLGTWAGDSICVGDRPACKNEHVVYRFVAVDARPRFVRLLADKVIDGKRVPMGALEFEYNDADATLTSEFTRGQTHGVWAYKVSGDTMTGTLVILPDKTLGRRVSVRRFSEDQVPKAPALEEYVSVVRQCWCGRVLAEQLKNSCGAACEVVTSHSRQAADNSMLNYAGTRRRFGL